MRHKAQVSHFGRDNDHRRALMRNLVDSLVEHGRIETTLAKARELRRHAERAVTLAKKGSLSARRILLSRFPNEKTVVALMSDLAVRHKERAGGYTRILKVGKRLGDKAEMALIEWVDFIRPVKAEDSEVVKKTTVVKKASKASPAKGKKKTTGKSNE